MFKNILAATDMVTVCDSQVLSAAQIAKQNHAKLHILHVLESGSVEDRHLIKHFKTGVEIATNTNYEKTVKKERNKVYVEVLKPLMI